MTRQATLVVLAAASLSEVFAEIGQRFEAEHPGVAVLLNLAGSQQLAQQLAQGAPADVFASADEKQMGIAAQAGRIAAGSSQPFAHNRLVVIYPQDNPAGLEKLQDLAKPGLRLVLAASEAPVGRYSLVFLDRTSQTPAFGPDYAAAVLGNVVSYEQTVKAVLAKVQLGEGDAGIVYVSDVNAGNAGLIGILEIPDSLNPAATYLLAPISDSAEHELAQAFIRLVLSPDGQEILARHGFLPIK